MKRKKYVWGKKWAEAPKMCRRHWETFCVLKNASVRSVLVKNKRSPPLPPPPRVQEETGRGWNKRAPLSCRLGRLQRLTGGLYVCQAVWIVVSGCLDVTLDPAGFFCVVARRADSSSPLFSSLLHGGRVHRSGYNKIAAPASRSSRKSALGSKL